MNYDDKALEIISESIKKAVQHNIATAPFDKTTEGRIIASLGSGKYTVGINGTNYTVKAYGGAIYQINDVVRITIPQNDYSNMYILPSGGSDGDIITAEEVQNNLDGHTNTTSVHTSQTEKDTWNSAVLNSHSNYTHFQIVSAFTWTVTHNLNRFPSVTIIDSAGSVVLGEVKHISENQIELNFNAPFSGKAYLN